MEVAAQLRGAHPEAAGVPQDRLVSNGQLPLHWAAAKQASAKVVETLLCVRPEAARIKDSFGKIPEDYAASEQASEEVVRLLIDAR